MEAALRQGERTYNSHQLANKLETEKGIKLTADHYLVTIALGWIIYLLALKKLVISFPCGLEKIAYLIGLMSLTFIALFWLVVPS